MISYFRIYDKIQHGSDLTLKIVKFVWSCWHHNLALLTEMKKKLRSSVDLGSYSLIYNSMCLQISVQKQG